jgi:hypothetical protein
MTLQDLTDVGRHYRPPEHRATTQLLTVSSRSVLETKRSARVAPALVELESQFIELKTQLAAE